ncbi:hypothetical protein CVT26_004949, partial [Gymnopilus dilepis]
MDAAADRFKEAAEKCVKHAKRHDGSVDAFVPPLFRRFEELVQYLRTNKSEAQSFKNKASADVFLKHIWTFFHNNRQRLLAMDPIAWDPRMVPQASLQPDEPEKFTDRGKKLAIFTGNEVAPAAGIPKHVGQDVAMEDATRGATGDGVRVKAAETPVEGMVTRGRSGAKELGGSVGVKGKGRASDEMEVDEKRGEGKAQPEEAKKTTRTNQKKRDAPGDEGDEASSANKKPNFTKVVIRRPKLTPSVVDSDMDNSEDLPGDKNRGLAVGSSRQKRDASLKHKGPPDPLNGAYWVDMKDIPGMQPCDFCRAQGHKHLGCWLAYSPNAEGLKKGKYPPGQKLVYRSHVCRPCKVNQTKCKWVNGWTPCALKNLSPTHKHTDACKPIRAHDEAEQRRHWDPSKQAEDISDEESPSKGEPPAKKTKLSPAEKPPKKPRQQSAKARAKKEKEAERSAGRSATEMEVDPKAEPTPDPPPAATLPAPTVPQFSGMFTVQVPSIEISQSTPGVPAPTTSIATVQPKVEIEHESTDSRILIERLSQRLLKLETSLSVHHGALADRISDAEKNWDQKFNKFSDAHRNALPTAIEGHVEKTWARVSKELYAKVDEDVRERKDWQDRQLGVFGDLRSSFDQRLEDLRVQQETIRNKIDGLERATGFSTAPGREPVCLALEEVKQERTGQMNSVLEALTTQSTMLFKILGQGQETQESLKLLKSGQETANDRLSPLSIPPPPQITPPPLPSSNEPTIPQTINPHLLNSDWRRVPETSRQMEDSAQDQ